MTCNEYLKELCTDIEIANERESSSIDASIEMLKKHLDNWSLSEEIIDHHEFGSYVRKTKLPSSIDSSTDIDYMVVFDNSRLRAESYIERLRRFAKKYYPNSKVHKDHPTMVIELDHVKFEITPAVKLYGKSYPRYNIPGPQELAVEWIDTYPEQMLIELESAERSNHHQIRNLIRLLKYWNVLNGKPLTSYKIEHTATHLVFYQQATLIEYFLYAAQWLSMDQFLAGDARKKVDALRDDAVRINNMLKNGFQAVALAYMKNSLPEINH